MSAAALQSSSLVATKLPSSPVSEHHITAISQDYETLCWGCGLRLILPSQAPVFKCGWCGAITIQNASRCEHKSVRWKRLRDRCFVAVLLIFMILVICGGVWAVYPIVFSISYLCGAFHIVLIIILSVITISMFVLAAFHDAGTPPEIIWGSYPAVAQGGLEEYTFCQYCSKPKSPRTHHCSSCGMCVLDMDHHCPFIGNCVGAANHRYFINFLILAIISMAYVTITSAYAGLHIMPPWSSPTLEHLQQSHSNMALLHVLKDIVIGFLTSAVIFSPRGLILIYLFVASISVEIGLGVLLWQQLCFIYEGKTYLSQLSSRGGGDGERDFRNLYRFFGCSYLASRYLQRCCNSKKIHRK